MAKSSEQRGTFGAWLVAQRERLGRERKVKLTAEQVRQEIADWGYPLGDAHYRALESGAKRPGRETREALARFFGQEPPSAEPQVGQDLGPLVLAIREQTAKMAELVGLLRTGAMAGVSEGYARWLAEEAAREVDGAPDASPELPPPDARS